MTVVLRTENKLNNKKEKKRNDETLSKIPNPVKPNLGSVTILSSRTGAQRRMWAYLAIVRCLYWCRHFSWHQLIMKCNPIKWRPFALCFADVACWGPTAGSPSYWVNKGVKISLLWKNEDISFVWNLGTCIKTRKDLVQHCSCIPCVIEEHNTKILKVL